MMAKQPIASILAIVLIAVALLSIFLPLLEVQLPMNKTQSVSVFQSIAKAMPSPGKQKADKPATKPGGKSITDMLPLDSLKDMLVKQFKEGGAKLLKEKPVYALIPVGILSGVLAHILLPVILVMVLLKRKSGTFITSLSSGVLIALFFASVVLLNDALQHVTSTPVQRIMDNPLAGLTMTLSSVQLGIEAGAAIYVILIATLSLAAVTWLTKRTA